MDANISALRDRTKTRSDDELLRVIHAPDEYRSEAVELARAELTARGISLDPLPEEYEQPGSRSTELPRTPVVSTIFRWLDALDFLALVGFVLLLVAAAAIWTFTRLRALW